MVIEFSVIIPLLNKGQYIGRAVKSVLNQTHENFEIIVVDGGSSDEGPEIIKDFNDPRIHFFGQSGKGVSNARNEGVHSAKNEFIAFLDADDEWKPRHLETLQKLILKFPEAGMYATAYKICNKKGQIFWADFRFIPDPPWEGIIPDYFKSGALGGYPVGMLVVAIPKKIFLEVGGFDEGYWYGEDVDLFGKISFRYPTAFSWEYGGLYHQDAGNHACDREIPPDYIEPFVITARRALENREVPEKYIQSVKEFVFKLELLRAVRNVHAGRSDDAGLILHQCETKFQIKDKIKWILLAKLPYPLFIFSRDLRRKFLTMKRTIKNG